jgi:putative aldouronate transport system permease protein
MMLLRIIIPLSTPVLATLVIFYGVRQWNQFFSALIYINSPAKYTLQLRLQIMLDTWSSTIGDTSDLRQYGTKLIPQGIKTAAIVVAAAPIILIYPFLQKYFIKGAMLGALKG